MPDSNPYLQSPLSVAKGITLEPIKPDIPVTLNDKAIGTTQLDPKTVEQLKNGEDKKKGLDAPEPDERLKAFFRVKIGGMAATPDPTKPGPGLPQPEVEESTPAAGERVVSTFSAVAGFYKASDAKALVAAHKTLPLGTKVKVTHQGKSIVVEIKGKSTSDKGIDLSEAAASAIELKTQSEVKCEVLAADEKTAIADSKAPNPLAPEGSKFDQSVKLTKADLSDFGTQPLDLSGTIGTGGKLDAATAKQLVTPPIASPNLPDTPREMIFDSARGDFLGRPYVRLSTYQHATAKFVINDPDDSIRPLVAKLQNVEVEMGFVNGFKINKFVGVIYTIGRQLPGGTEIEAVDLAYQMQGATSAASSTTAVTPPPPGTANASSGDREVTSTFEGEASFYGGGTDGFDGRKTASGEIFDSSKLTAAHRTLPFGTEVRVTNTVTGKSVIVKVNDRGPFAKDRVIDLSKAAAEQIGMVASGHAKVKGEVLGKKTATTATSATTPPTPPAEPAKTPLSPTTSTSPPKTTPVATPEKSVDPLGIQPNPEAANGNGTRKATLAEIYSQNSNLKFVDNSPVKIQKEGDVSLQQSAMAAAELESALKGDVIVARGQTLTTVSPGQGESSGVIFNFKENRAAFISGPTVKKRTGVHLQSGYGSITVQSWNPNDKRMVGATVATSAPVIQHPTGVIQAPDWGSIKLSDPIVPGSPYTWADATKNGARVPQSKEIMNRIVRICVIITQLTKETGQTKWVITSWYRDPVSNRGAGGAKDSRHLYGDGVDFFFSGPEYLKLFQRLWADGPSGSGGWAGGVAKGNGFTHIDNRDAENRPRSRWYYKGAR